MKGHWSLDVRATRRFAQSNLAGMEDTFILGITIGTGLALLYGVSSLVAHRFALRANDRNQFLGIVFGGLLTRMALALLSVMLVISYVSVSVTAFIGSFFGVFVVSLIIEVLYLHRQTGDLVSEMSDDG